MLLLYEITVPIVVITTVIGDIIVMQYTDL